MLEAVQIYDWVDTGSALAIAAKRKSALKLNTVPTVA